MDMQQPDWTDFPRNALEFDERFGSEEACQAYLLKQRWPEGFRCPSCGHNESWNLKRRRLLECRDCSRQVSLTAGTAFHGSRKPLRLWFKAMFLMTGTNTGISARSLRKQLGLGSYQTAWTWMHKLRRATIRPEREPLSGPVEADEAYVGGVDRGTSGREIGTKSLVAVAVEVREDGAGRLRMAKVEDASQESLDAFVKGNVVGGSQVKTDGWVGYNGLRKAGYQHRRRVIRDPKRASRLFPHVHRAISLFKRRLLGTYQGAVRGKHLSAYLDEFVFRFNRRRSRLVTLPFKRLCAIASITAPLTYRALVAHNTW
jgi:transposase-like protein